MKTFNTHFNTVKNIDMHLGVIINEDTFKAETIQLNLVIGPTPAPVRYKTINTDDENFDITTAVNDIIVYIQQKYFFVHSEYLTDEDVVEIKRHLQKFFNEWLEFCSNNSSIM